MQESAGGASTILLPEIPWTWENVCQKIFERDNEGKRFSLIVVAEGAELPEMGLVKQQVAETGQDRLGGIGHIIARELEDRIKRETRVVVLGHLQRGGPPTNFDRVLATQFGAHAVRLVMEGKFGSMVSYNPPTINSVADPGCRAPNFQRLPRQFGRRRGTGARCELLGNTRLVSPPSFMHSANDVSTAKNSTKVRRLSNCRPLTAIPSPGQRGSIGRKTERRSLPPASRAGPPPHGVVVGHVFGCGLSRALPICGRCGT